MLTYAPAGPIAAAIRERRTHKAFNGQAIPHELITELLELGTWAPNHRLSQPWRFYVLDQPAIGRLCDFLPTQQHLAPDERGQGKLRKVLDRLKGVGAVIQVTWIKDADPEIDLEEHAATCAAVQNILLGAHERGLVSYWSSTMALADSETLRWCGADPAREGFTASVWLGGKVEDVKAPKRQALVERVRWV